MFSKYKKPGAGGDTTKIGGKANLVAVPDPVKEPTQKKSLMRAMPLEAVVDVAAANKEKRRKVRLSEIKVELHKALLDSLNLAALETATEADLRAEIDAIAAETLDEMGIFLNREERLTLTQDLYF